MTIAESIVNTSSYNWEVPANFEELYNIDFEENAYRIKVTNSCNSYFFAVSKRDLHIALPQIRVTNLSETLKAGKNCLLEIEYTGKNFDSKMDLYRNGEYYTTLSDSVFFDSTSIHKYHWEIPSTIQVSGNFNIKFGSTNGDIAYKSVDKVFSIVPTIIVTSPGKDVKLQGHHILHINWTAFGDFPYVNVYLCSENSNSLIAEKTQNDGHFQYVIPQGSLLNDVHIKIAKYNEPDDIFETPQPMKYAGISKGKLSTYISLTENEFNEFLGEVFEEENFELPPFIEFPGSSDSLRWAKDRLKECRDDARWGDHDKDGIPNYRDDDYDEKTTPVRTAVIDDSKPEPEPIIPEPDYGSDWVWVETPTGGEWHGVDDEGAPTILHVGENGTIPFISKQGEDKKWVTHIMLPAPDPNIDPGASAGDDHNGSDLFDDSITIFDTPEDEDPPDNNDEVDDSYFTENHKLRPGDNIEKIDHWGMANSGGGEDLVKIGDTHYSISFYSNEEEDLHYIELQPMIEISPGKWVCDYSKLVYREFFEDADFQEPKYEMEIGRWENTSIGHITLLELLNVQKFMMKPNLNLLLPIWMKMIM